MTQSLARQSALLKKGSQILNQRCVHKITCFKPLDEEVLDTIDLCIDELRNATGFWKGKGMSIAATQVGKPNMPVFLICARENWYTSRQYKKFQTILNPRITAYSENMCLAWEGCVSNDDEMVLIERPIQVQATFDDTKGKEYTMNMTGLMSRIFQHEIDHLNGLVMWDDTVPDTISTYQPEGVKITPRRIQKFQPISELIT